MKIVFISPYFLPVRGGVENHIYQLGRQLVSRGEEVLIVTGNRDHQGKKLSVSAQEVMAGLTIIRLPVVAGSARIFPGGWVLGLTKQLRKINPEVVHFHNDAYSFWGLLIARLAKKNKFNLFFTPHFHQLKIIGPRSLLRYFSNLLLARRAKAVFFVSSFEEKLFFNKFSRVKDLKNKALVIGNGLADIFFQPINRLPDGEKKLLFVGGERKGKNIPELLEIFQQVSLTNQKSKLVLVGRGTKQQKYLQLAKKLKIASRVEFKGEVSDEVLLTYYDQAYLFLTASRQESFGLAVIEALARGLPVIAYDYGPFPEIIKDTVNGRLVTKQQDFIAAILDLLNNPDLHQKYSEQAIVSIRDYNWINIVEKVWPVYNKYL